MEKKVGKFFFLAIFVILFIGFVSADYLCGDADLNGEINEADITKVSDYAFRGVEIPEGTNADLNEDGVVDILDVTFLTNYLFRDGPAPTCVVSQTIDKCSSLSSNVKNKIADLQASGETVVKKEGELVNWKGYLAITTNSGGGMVLRVETIKNDSSGYSNDEVLFKDAITGNNYGTTILAEGVGVVTIDGRAYEVRYYGRNIDSAADRKIALMSPPTNEIHTFYCSFSQNQTCTNDCVAVGLKLCYEDSGLLKTCGNYDSDSCLEWSAGTTCPYGCNVNGCNSSPGNQTNQPVCIDSDGGKNYDVQGTVNAVTSIVQDYCWGDNQLTEYYCSGNIFNATYYSCPLENKICLNGACASKNNQTNQTFGCTDTDNGVNFYVKGGVSRIINGVRLPTTGHDYDYCQGVGGNMVSEFSCGEDYSLKQTDFVCSQGCSDGACRKIEVAPTPETGPIELPDDDEEETEITPYFCSGCVEDKKCYPFGYRKNGYYCSDSNYLFIRQKTGSTEDCVPGAENECQGELSCENNFECKSNVCANEQCITQGFLKKVLDWFGRLFGG